VPFPRLRSAGCEAEGLQACDLHSRHGHRPHGADTQAQRAQGLSLVLTCACAAVLLACDGAVCSVSHGSVPVLCEQAIGQFDTSEKGKMVVHCDRSNGGVSTNTINVLSIKGIRRFLVESGSADAAQVWK
jgi:hypothetical protein